MTSHTSTRFWKNYERLPKQVRRQARAAYEQFLIDPQHPGLQFKRIHAALPIYSVRINRDYRAVGVRDNDDILWFWIGPHAEYDKLIDSLR